MKKYELVLEHSREDLNEKITSMLNDGWEVAGSLTISKDDEGFPYLYQPMIKHDLGTPH
ncbi:DUF1737 domain-containing protein [Kiloniella sp.]|uniref:DUF1737 domain-containing protein n=1 Tax=Kiloniella sp. TaxID=1938587 RepID=UPI003B01CDD2